MLKHCFLLASVLLISTATAQAGSPRLSRLLPPGGQRGTTVEAYFQGKYLDKPDEVLLYEPGITVESVEALEGEVQINGRKEKVEAGTRVRVRLKLADDCPLGLHGVRLRTANGLTDYQRFFVGPFPTVEEDEQTQKRNDKRDAAKVVPLNSTVLGRMLEQTDVDLYQIDVKKGQRISAEIEAARLGVDRGIPDLHVAVLDENGKTLIAADDSALFVQDPVVSILADRDGIYFVEVRHSIFNAAGETYRLHVGTFSRPTGVYPAGGQAGEELSVRLLGDPKGDWMQAVKFPKSFVGRFSKPSEPSTSNSNDLENRPTSNESFDFSFVAIDADNVATPTPNKLRVSPFPNVLEAEPNDTPEAITSVSAATLPIAFNGIIEKPGDVDCFRFQAKKGDRFKVLALANVLGSPLDPTIWIKSLAAKPGAPIRATDSRPNQLGYPPIGGLNRDTLDPAIEFTVPADGEYVLGVEDDRGNGGKDFVYRVEFTPETDAVLTYIPAEPENQFTPQARQVINVPSGGRYNTSVSILNTNRPFNGELELVAVGLPDGVKMIAPRVTTAMPRVPVVFEAAAGTKLQGGLIEILAQPVRSVSFQLATPETTSTAANESASKGDQAKEKEREQAGSLPHVASGFRQMIAMNAYGNNDYYLHTVLDKLPLAVTEPAPFSIEIEEPKSALVQNGEMALKYNIRRVDGFDGPVTVSMEWKPNGVTGSTPITIKPGQADGEYVIGATRSATAGTYQVVLTVVSGGDRPGYYDGANRTYVCSQPFKLMVAEPHIDAKIARASIERGKTANLTVKLNHLKPFEGTAKTTLARLPRGVELVEPMREITSADKEVTFTLKATEDCLVGSYQGITLEVSVVEDGQSVRQLTGYGLLRIDVERGVKAASN